MVYQSHQHLNTECSLASQPLLTLTRDPVSGQYRLDKDDSLDSTNHNNNNNDDDASKNTTNRRTRRKRRQRRRHLEADWTRTTEAWSGHELERYLHSMSQDTIMVRECSCQENNNNSTLPDFSTFHPTNGTTMTNTSRQDHNRTTWYCPADRLVCERTGTAIPRCYQASVSEFIGNLWPVVLLWFGMFAFALAFSNVGRFARHYVVLVVISWWSRDERRQEALRNQQLDRLMQHQPGYVVRLAREYRRRQTAILWRNLQMQQQENVPLSNPTLQGTVVNEQEPANTNNPMAPVSFESQSTPPDNTNNNNRTSRPLQQPTSLTLRTRRHVVTQQQQYNDLDNTELEIVCAICLGPIQVGDRVGVLECRHDFHVDCLKIWLQRKNQCPLCQTPQVATEHFQDEHERRD